MTLNSEETDRKVNNHTVNTSGEKIPAVDLGFLLLDESNVDSRRLEIKGKMSKLLDQFKEETLLRADIFIKIFTIHGLASRRKGGKIQFKHIHMFFIHYHHLLKQIK